MVIEYIMAIALGFIVAVGTGPMWIPYFRKLKFGQFIREEGPQSHLQKGGTPTFGGVIFIVAAVISVMTLKLFSINTMAVVTSTLLFGFVGFLDDYQKVIKKNNLGLNAKQKMASLLIVSTLLYVFYFIGHKSNFWGLVSIENAIIVFILFIFIAVAVTNSVNLTDGIDGLCASVTMIISLFFAAYSYYLGNYDLLLVNAVFTGALLGYLVYNWHPAKVFMGDTGSLALGGYVFANAMLLNIEWFLPLFGMVYVLEALSVIIQVLYFKKTGGKRFFRMSPLHHHFELGGWSEKKIVYVASSLTIALSLISYFLIIL